MSNAERIQILLVDDNEKDLEAIRRTLRSSRFEVTIATSLSESTRHLEETEFDLALVDLHLGDGQGTEWLGEFSGTPVIVLTGASDVELAVSFIHSGAYDCLVKDLSGRYLANLPSRVHSALQRRKTERDAEQARKSEAKAVAELRRAKEVAETALEMRGTFLANMSHEIRTPLTAILGFADLLAEELEESQSLDSLNTIRENGHHLLQLINDILDLSKIEAGRLDVEILLSRPQEIVDQVERLMKVRAEECGVDLGFHYSTDIPETVHTDPTRLRQILINLIGNAIKFTERGSVDVEISCVSATGDPFGEAAPPDEGAVLCLSVKDTGIGISDEELARLFEPFTQADPSSTRRFGGTGLGLTISKWLAHRLGGDIVATSQPGKGSTFLLSLPTGPLHGVRMVAPGKIQKLPVSMNPPEDPQALPPCRILLAEDGAPSRMLISRILELRGATVVAVADGAKAVEAIDRANDEGDPFDAILMDMLMPVMDGLTATRVLRSNGHRVPIIAVTANAFRGDMDACREAGCDAIVTKPINRVELIEIIREYVESGTNSESRSA